MFKILIISLLLGGNVQAQLTLTMGGDVNFNKNFMMVDASGFLADKSTITWSTFTKYLEPLLDGDLNFANVETVISDRHDLTAITTLTILA